MRGYVYQKNDGLARETANKIDAGYGMAMEEFIKFCSTLGSHMRQGSNLRCKKLFILLGVVVIANCYLISSKI